ncbi:MAG: hypothetical protein GF331_20405 [Chitinivibrionales bacterium]|nr:hypothetical protein [Chitinivibrionales bacterium]
MMTDLHLRSTAGLTGDNGAGVPSALLLAIAVVCAAMSCTYAPIDLEDEPHAFCFGLECPDSSLKGTWTRDTIDLAISDTNVFFVSYTWKFRHCKYIVEVDEQDTAASNSGDCSLYRWQSTGYWTSDSGALRFSDAGPPTYGPEPAPLTSSRTWTNVECTPATLVDWQPRRYPLGDTSRTYTPLRPAAVNSHHYSYELLDSSHMILRYVVGDSLLYEAEYYRSGDAYY